MNANKAKFCTASFDITHWQVEVNEKEKALQGLHNMSSGYTLCTQIQCLNDLLAKVSIDFELTWLVNVSYLDTLIFLIDSLDVPTWSAQPLSPLLTSVVFSQNSAMLGRIYHTFCYKF